MSKLSILQHRTADEHSYNITEILMVSRNKKQLTQLAKRLGRFTGTESDFSVITPDNPIVVNNSLGFKSNHDCDENHAYINNEFDNIPRSDVDGLNFSSIINSATTPEIESVFSYVLSHSDSWKEKEAIKKKISLAKKNGDYYQNNEKYANLEY